MKLENRIQTAIGLLGTATLMAGLAGCGGSDPAAPASTGSNPLSPQFVSQMQNGAGCLDLGKVMQAAATARASRNFVTDLEFPEDRATVSPAFFNLLIHNTDLVESPVRRDRRVQQNGCASLVYFSGRQGSEAIILEAGPTRLVVEPVRNSGADRDGRSVAVQIIYELTVDNQLRTSSTNAYSLTHDCGSKNRRQESHKVLAVRILDWGDAISGNPQISSSVAPMEDASRSYDLALQAGREAELERSYCSASIHF